MSGKSMLETLGKKQVSQPPDIPGQVEAQPDPDSVMEPSGDGRTSRHQVLGLEVEDSAKNLWFFPYGVFQPCKLGKVNGDSFTFKIAGEDCNYELIIEGPVAAARYAIDKLCSGKRELLRPNESSITGIVVREIPVAKRAAP